MLCRPSETVKLAEIKELVETEFEEHPSSLEEVEEGLKQKTYRVKVGGEKYILQLSDKLDEGYNGLERNVKAYQLLKDTSVSVPELVTEELRRYENGQEWKYYISGCLPGESLESQMTPELTSKSGEILAKLHNFQSYDEAGWLLPEENGFSVVPFEEGGFKNYVLQNWRESIETFEDEDWNELTEKSREFLENYGKRLLPEDVNPVFCHDDFSTQNIMADDGEITGIIDFDMAHSGHNQRDLVKAANSFWMIDPGENTGIRENLYKGYRQEKELEENFNQNEPIYRVETLTGIVAGLIRMNHFSDFEKNFYRKHLKRIINEAEKQINLL